jgi:CarD family transcriptional regulator
LPGCMQRANIVLLSTMFEVGQRILYPHHGVVTLESVEEREVSGCKSTYYVLRMESESLTLRVPTDAAEQVGLRPLIPRSEVSRVLQALSDRNTLQPENTANWSRRFKEHVDKIRSGDVYQLVEVVKGLTLRERERGLSLGEKRTLHKARQILVEELAFASETPRDEMERMVDQVLGG